MRSIKQIHTAVSSPMDNLITFVALPVRNHFERFDPFLVLNHHGVQHFPPHNAGLPFGPHPHRGMETLTFIYQGDLTHRDSTGGDSVISEGGVQWMTAGRGIIHEEVSSKEFKEKGGTLDIIQVWFNLPAALKMMQPSYTGLQKDQLTHVESDHGKTALHIVAGNWSGKKGPIESVSGISIATLEMKRTAKYSVSIPLSDTILFYVVGGEVIVNEINAGLHDLVEFGNDDENIEIEALQDSRIILGFGKPTDESIVAYGPFVMNSEEEIEQAYSDYRAGLFKS